MNLTTGFVADGITKLLGLVEGRAIRTIGSLRRDFPFFQKETDIDNTCVHTDLDCRFVGGDFISQV